MRGIRGVEAPGGADGMGQAMARRVRVKVVTAATPGALERDLNAALAALHRAGHAVRAVQVFAPRSAAIVYATRGGAAAGRAGFLVASAAALLVVGGLWAVAREAPSAEVAPVARERRPTPTPPRVVIAPLRGRPFPTAPPLAPPTPTPTGWEQLVGVRGTPAQPTIVRGTPAPPPGSRSAALPAERPRGPR